jgi:hypothetical protein
MFVSVASPALELACKLEVNKSGVKRAYDEYVAINPFESQFDSSVVSMSLTSAYNRAVAGTQCNVWAVQLAIVQVVNIIGTRVTK